MVKYFLKDEQNIEISFDEVQKIVLLDYLGKLVEKNITDGKKCFQIGLFSAKINNFISIINNSDKVLSNNLEKMLLSAVIKNFNNLNDSNFNLEKFKNFFKQIIEDFLNNSKKIDVIVS